VLSAPQIVEPIRLAQLLDTSDFKNPTVLGAPRTVGYVSKLVRDAIT
jgi:hypothetical protein